MSDPFLSVITYPGNGVTTEFAITFAGGYLSRDHVKVRVIEADEVTVNEVAFTWVSDTQISVVPAPASGKTVQIARETPFEAPIVDFADGAVINEDTLDLNAKQAIFLAAELRDRFGTATTMSEVLEVITAANTATANLAALTDEIALFGLARVYDVWSTLEDVIGAPGDVAVTLVQDGYHTDPVVGGSVANSGFFRWNVSPAGWYRFADTQAAIAIGAAEEAEGFAAALAIATAGGWYDSLAAGAADASVAEGDGYFYLTSGRFYIGRKVGGIGVMQAEFLTTAASLAAILGSALTALSTLIPAADQVPYYTGTSTSALTTLSAAGRAVIGAADAAAQRTALGLVIGTNVQAFDADLAAIAALSTQAFGRSLLTSADAAALRTMLGLALTGDGSSGKYTAGPFVLSWRVHTIPNNTSAAFGYGDGHTYTTWAKAWISGDDGVGDQSYTVTTSGLTTATVRSNGNTPGTGTLFCIGV